MLKAKSAAHAPDGISKLMRHYGCGPVAFTGADDALYERRLLFDHVIDPKSAKPREQFEAVSWAIRDVLSQRWLKTLQHHDRANPKQVYYLSMEFLIGRSLMNNVTNLLLSPAVEAVEKAKAIRLAELVEEEPDAGLGNGGLGRLAACFIDSLATLEIPAIGYGLRYDFGIFRQELRNGNQVEQPDNWLSRPDPWEVVRPTENVSVPLQSSFRSACGADFRSSRKSHALAWRAIRSASRWLRRQDNQYAAIVGVPRRRTCSTSANSAAGISSARCPIECWPNRSPECSIRTIPPRRADRCASCRNTSSFAARWRDIVARFRRRGNDWAALPGQGCHSTQRHTPGDGRGRTHAHSAR